MTEPEKESTRSRRRFLADVLFIGGGLSAAAILAKTQIFDKKKKQCPPDIAGDMIPPEPPPHPTGAAPVREIPAEQLPTPQASPQQPPMPGEPVPTQSCPSPQTTASPHPQPGGKPVAPKPEGGR